VIWTQGITIAIIKRWYSDDPGGSRTNDAWQEKAGEEEVTEVVNADVHLEAVFSGGLRAETDTWKKDRWQWNIYETSGIMLRNIEKIDLQSMMELAKIKEF
jgi:hypothetical protein